METELTDSAESEVGGSSAHRTNATRYLKTSWSQIAPALLIKNSDFTHIDSTPLRSVALSTVTRGNDVTRQFFKIKIDLIFFPCLHSILSVQSCL